MSRVIETPEFDAGAPSDAAAALLYDPLDLVHGTQALLGALPGASLVAVRRGPHFGSGLTIDTAAELYAGKA